MTATTRFNLLILTAVALVLVAALSSGCGPTRSVVSSTPAPTATAGVCSASVIMPEASLPPLPGAMSGGAPHPETAEPDSDSASGADEQLNP